MVHLAALQQQKTKDKLILKGWNQIRTQDAKSVETRRTRVSNNLRARTSQWESLPEALASVN